VRSAEAREPHRGGPVEWQEYEEAEWCPLYPLAGKVAKFLVDVRRDQSGRVEARDQSGEAQVFGF